MKRFLATWTINTLSVLMAVNLVGGFHWSNAASLLCASLLLGILNAFLRPILLLLTLPLLLLSLGLFRFAINGLVLYLISFLLRPRFYVDGFGSAFLGALVISVTSTLLHLMTGTGPTRVKFQAAGRRPPPDGGRGGGDGPVIDV